MLKLENISNAALIYSSVTPSVQLDAKGGTAPSVSITDSDTIISICADSELLNDIRHGRVLVVCGLRCQKRKKLVY